MTKARKTPRRSCNENDWQNRFCVLRSLCLRQSIAQTADFDLSDVFAATNSLDVYTVLRGYLFLFLRCQKVNSP